MSELGEKLLASAGASFESKLRHDRKLRVLANRARDGTSYVVANEYSARAGELLGQAVKEATRQYGPITSEIAEEVLTPLLTSDHDIVSTISQAILTNVNKSNNLGLKAVSVATDVNRISGIVKNAVTGDPDAMLDEIIDEIISFSQSVADEILETNAEKASDLGLKATIVRKAESPAFPSGVKTVHAKNGKVYTYEWSRYPYYEKPCEWCKSLEGTYDYDEVKNTGNDVFRRHKGCRCTVEYHQDGYVQDVWSKTVWGEQDADRKKDLIRDKEEERKREVLRKEEAAKKKAAVCDRVIRDLRYDAKSASIWYNANKNNIERLGVDYMIEWARSQQQNRTRWS